MRKLEKSAKFVLETCIGLKKGDKLLVLTDTGAWPMRMGETLMDMADAMGAEAVLSIIKPLEIAGDELPAAVAEAMKAVDCVLWVSTRIGIGHSKAAKDARDSGVAIKQMNEVPEGYLDREFSAEEIYRLKERTEKVSAKLAAAEAVALTTPYGTNITMSLKGRDAIAINPLGRGMLPDYGEAAITPVEGTAEGVIVVDLAMIGWGYVLREPLRYTVKAGKVVAITGPQEEAERLSQIAGTDEGANNIAELAIGTSTTIAGPILGTRWDAGRLGYVHIAMGRNTDIGGKTWSKIHIDGIMTRATMHLDGVCVLKDGVLKI